MQSELQSLLIGQVWNWVGIERHRGCPSASNGTKYIDARKRCPLDEFPYRTTLCLRASGWELVERCARYALKDPSRLDAMNATQAITILSWEWIDVEDLEFLSFLRVKRPGPSMVEFNLQLLMKADLH